MASGLPEHIPGPVGQCIGDVEPESSFYTEVLQSEHREIWEDTEAQELGGSRIDEMFTLATAPRRRSPIVAKWVYKWETNECGEGTKATNRIVANGFSQKPGVDFNEMFAPNPPSPSIRLSVATPIKQNMDFSIGIPSKHSSRRILIPRCT